MRRIRSRFFSFSIQGDIHTVCMRMAGLTNAPLAFLYLFLFSLPVTMTGPDTKHTREAQKIPKQNRFTFFLLFKETSSLHGNKNQIKRTDTSPTFAERNTEVPPLSTVCYDPVYVLSPLCKSIAVHKPPENEQSPHSQILSVISHHFLFEKKNPPNYNSSSEEEGEEKQEKKIKQGFRKDHGPLPFFLFFHVISLHLQHSPAL
jgi:hypothetical protein